MVTTATLADVALKAGVSTATVSRFLSGTSAVAPATKAKVQQAMDELNYHPNRMARALRTQQTKQIGVVLPGFENQFFFELLFHIERAARERGFGVLIAGDRSLPECLHNLQSGGAVDGIILASSSWPKATPPKTTIPMVCIDRPLPGAHATFVSVDNVQGARAVAEHLLTRGATTFGLLTGPLSIPAAQERRAGFYQAVHGATVTEQEGDFTSQAGIDFVDALDQAHLPDAIFACNDLMAAGIVSRLQEHNLNTMVAGFDGITSATTLYPRITTLVQPQEKLARMAVDKLVQEIEETGTNRKRNKQQIYLPGTLRVGDTTAGHNKNNIKEHKQ